MKRSRYGTFYIANYYILIFFAIIACQILSQVVNKHRRARAMPYSMRIIMRAR